MPGQNWKLGAAAAAAVLLAATLGTSGCEKEVHEARSAPPAPTAVAASSAAAATQPTGDAVPATAHVEAASDPAASQPASVLTIEGVGAPFPPTKLLLHEKDGGRRIVAELFSDLPQSALRKYDGHELYLEMTLESAEGGKVDHAAWRFKSTSSEKADSPNGIFLNGQQTHLQPDDVRVQFERRNDQLFAQVMGRFRAYESGTPDALAPFVGVRGELPVELVQKR